METREMKELRGLIAIVEAWEHESETDKNDNEGEDREFYRGKELALYDVLGLLRNYADENGLKTKFEASKWQIYNAVTKETKQKVEDGDVSGRNARTYMRGVVDVLNKIYGEDASLWNLANVNFPKYGKNWDRMY